MKIKKNVLFIQTKDLSRNDQHGRYKQKLILPLISRNNDVPLLSKKIIIYYVMNSDTFLASKNMSRISLYKVGKKVV